MKIIIKRVVLLVIAILFLTGASASTKCKQLLVEFENGTPQTFQVASNPRADDVIPSLLSGQGISSKFLNPDEIPNVGSITFISPGAFYIVLNYDLCAAQEYVSSTIQSGLNMAVKYYPKGPQEIYSKVVFTIAPH